jgi:L-lactate permease
VVGGTRWDRVSVADSSGRLPPPYKRSANPVVAEPFSLNPWRVQVVITAFCFGALLEALAGFGTPVAICGVMLMGLGLAFAAEEPRHCRWALVELPLCGVGEVCLGAAVAASTTGVIQPRDFSFARRSGGLVAASGAGWRLVLFPIVLTSTFEPIFVRPFRGVRP